MATENGGHEPEKWKRWLWDEGMMRRIYFVTVPYHAVPSSHLRDGAQVRARWQKHTETGRVAENEEWQSKVCATSSSVPPCASRVPMPRRKRADGGKGAGGWRVGGSTNCSRILREIQSESFQRRAGGSRLMVGGEKQKCGGVQAVLIVDPSARSARFFVGSAIQGPVVNKPSSPPIPPFLVRVASKLVVQEVSEKIGKYTNLFYANLGLSEFIFVAVVWNSESSSHIAAVNRQPLESARRGMDLIEFVISTISTADSDEPNSKARVHASGNQSLRTSSALSDLGSFFMAPGLDALTICLVVGLCIRSKKSVEPDNWVPHGISLVSAAHLSPLYAGLLPLKHSRTCTGTSSPPGYLTASSTCPATVAGPNVFSRQCFLAVFAVVDVEIQRTPQLFWHLKPDRSTPLLNLAPAPLPETTRWNPGAHA
ncbi:hypothetical protein B0H16DRAFT_1758938 [Mycena metata]|uniref:Uncharacterized protein n=1 Tax=Mycena metata TaxID=1033252 RepID=A0AAD7MZT7_9AGAR|nr:hypothetical protein B0H16DRAFT_1758938 [Mycena metata]